MTPFENELLNPQTINTLSQIQKDPKTTEIFIDF